MISKAELFRLAQHIETINAQRVISEAIKDIKAGLQ